MTVARSQSRRIVFTTSTKPCCRGTPSRTTSQATIAIVRCRAWSAANSIPGHGVQALPSPESGASPVTAIRVRAASWAFCSARRVALTFQRSTSMWVITTSAT